jgi:hypothetical protein
VSDAGIVYVTERALSMAPVGAAIYHVPSHSLYRKRTCCGLTIWSNDHLDWGLVPMRRDIASCFARICDRCDKYPQAMEP